MTASKVPSMGGAVNVSKSYSKVPEEAVSVASQLASSNSTRSFVSSLDRYTAVTISLCAK